MAEEHVLVPRERYQRLLDQTQEKMGGTSQQREDASTQTEENISVTENPHLINEKKDIDKNGNDEVSTREKSQDNVVHDPPPLLPGITREELAVMTTNKKKERQKKNLKKTTKSTGVLNLKTVKQTKNSVKKYPKTLSLVKKNWVTLKA